MIQQRVRRWTSDEDQFIKENYLLLSDEEIGKEIDRSRSSVKSERQKLGLHRPKTRGEIVNKTPHKIKFIDVQSKFKERGYTLLSNESEYKNQGSKLRYLCPRHLDKGELTITYGHLKEGKGCCYCGRERATKSRISTISFDEDMELCKLKGFEYVKTEKIGGKYTIFFYCPKHKEFGVQTMTRGNMNRDLVTGCQYCIGRNLPHWYVEKVIQDAHSDYTVISEYKGMNKKITCTCKKHNTIFTYDTKYMISNIHPCPECFKIHKSEICRLSNDTIYERVYRANPNIEIISLNDYKNCESKISIRCKKCGYQWKSPYSSIIANRTSCPACSVGSKGEQKLISILDTISVKTEPQYRIDDCKQKRSLPFDNSILDENNNLICLFEYHGEQHYHPVKYFGGEEKYALTIQRDKIKKQYCEQHNIPLLIIPYWEYDNMEFLVKEFLDKIL